MTINDELAAPERRKWLRRFSFIIHVMMTRNKNNFLTKSTRETIEKENMRSNGISLKSI